jgi:hypothetical protein
LLKIQQADPETGLLEASFESDGVVYSAGVAHKNSPRREMAPPGRAGLHRTVWAWIKKNIAVLAVVMTIFGGLIKHVEKDLSDAADKRITENLKEPLQRVNELSRDVAEIKGELEILDPMIRQLLGERIRKLASLPQEEFSANLSELTVALRISKQKQIQVEPEVVETIGKKLMQIPSAQPGVWPAVIQLATYRSFINAKQDPAYKPPKSAAFIIRPSTPIRVNGMTFDGFDQTLDYGMWENIIFRNCIIRYNGGPVTLRNVKFENCEFYLQTSGSSKELANRLWRSSAVTFSSVG